MTRGPVECAEFAVSDTDVSVIEDNVVDKADSIAKKSLAQQSSNKAH
jgi:hypothetical protein